jgi:hypothetical protein
MAQIMDYDELSECGDFPSFSIAIWKIARGHVLNYS